MYVVEFLLIPLKKRILPIFVLKINVKNGNNNAECQQRTVPHRKSAKVLLYVRPELTSN